MVSFRERIVVVPLRQDWNPLPLNINRRQQP